MVWVILASLRYLADVSDPDPEQVNTLRNAGGPILFSNDAHYFSLWLYGLPVIFRSVDLCTQQRVIEANTGRAAHAMPPYLDDAKHF
jgi:hypothetical protein